MLGSMDRSTEARRGSVEAKGRQGVAAGRILGVVGATCVFPASFPTDFGKLVGKVADSIHLMQFTLMS